MIVTVRFGGNYYIRVDGGRIDGSPKYFTLLDRAAGYTFAISTNAR